MNTAQYPISVVLFFVGVYLIFENKLGYYFNARAEEHMALTIFILAIIALLGGFILS